MCLELVVRALGCRDVTKVTVVKLKPSGSGPNWELAGLTPPVPSAAFAEANLAIAVLRGTYELDGL